MFGYFHEISGTNLILFAETERSDALREVSALGKRFAGLVTLILVLAIAVLSLSLIPVKRGLANLIIDAQRISRGDFILREVKSPFMDMRALGESFLLMSRDLKTRDSQIKKMHQDRERNLRLEASLDIAKNIQQNFLPTDRLYLQDFFEIETHYEPAEKVGGDWFNYCRNPDGSLIMCIADVSGHGPGAAMFTAILSAIFDESRNSESKFNIEGFIKSVNDRVLNLGQQQWMITLQIGVLQPAERTLTLYNCGHQFPLLGQKNKVCRKLMMPSSPLGLAEAPRIAKMIIEITEQTVLFCYTDAILETETADGRRYPVKKLKKILETATMHSADQYLKNFLTEWREMHHESKVEDDICLAVLKCG
jgi:sigma-B regulation protein RsbU (phosphoserine phosphatase)